MLSERIEFFIGDEMGYVDSSGSIEEVAQNH